MKKHTVGYVDMKDVVIAKMVGENKRG